MNCVDQYARKLQTFPVQNLCLCGHTALVQGIVRNHERADWPSLLLSETWRCSAEMSSQN